MAKSVGPIGEVALGERRSRNVSGVVLGHLESGAIGVIDKLGRQQERRGAGKIESPTTAAVIELAESYDALEGT